MSFFSLSDRYPKIHNNNNIKSYYKISTEMNVYDNKADKRYATVATTIYEKFNIN